MLPRAGTGAGQEICRLGKAGERRVGAEALRDQRGRRGAEPPGRQRIPAAAQAGDEPGRVGVAAPGGVDHRDAECWDERVGAAGDDPAAAGPQGHRHRPGARVQDCHDRAVQVRGRRDRQQLVGVRQEPVHETQQRGQPVKDLRGTGPEQVHGDQRAAGPGRGQRGRERCAGEPAEHVRAAHVQHVGGRDHAQVHVARPQVAGGPGHVQRRALPVRPDRQHGGGGLSARDPGQVAGVHAVPAQQRHQQTAKVVVADRAHRDHPGAELGQVHRRARRGPGGGQPDLLQQHAALAGRDRGDRAAEDVEDVRAEADHQRGRGRQCHAWPPGPRATVSPDVRRTSEIIQ